MSKNKKIEISLEEKLEKALVPVEEQAYKIPNNWVWTRLGEVNEVITGNTPSKNEESFWENKDISFIKPDDLSQGRQLVYSREYIDKRAVKKVRMLPKNTTLICCIGSIGKVAYSEIESCSNQQINSLVAKENCVYPLYNYYLVNSIFFQSQMLENSSATTISILNKSSTEKLLFPLPPLNEQKRIVEKLDFLFDKTKKAKEIIEEIKVDIENRKISILDRAFKGVLTSKWRNENKTSDVKELLKLINDEKIKKWEEDCLRAEKNGNKKPKKPIIREIEDMIVPVEEQLYKLPDSWVWVRLGDIIDNIKYGYNASGQENGEVKLLRITDIQNDDVNWRTVPYCKISEEEFEAYQLKVRDILIARTGGTIGKTFLIREIPKDLKSVYASYLIKFYPNKNISEIYLKNYFNTDLYWKLLKMKSRGTGQPNVNSPSLQALLVPLPPLEEQQEIVRILDEVLENENKVKELLELEEKIDILEKSILNKAFKGELGTQNSEDEFALELLKKII